MQPILPQGLYALLHEKKLPGDFRSPFKTLVNTASKVSYKYARLMTAKI